MNAEKQIMDALRKAVENAGSQLRLSEITGVQQSNINRTLSGKSSTGNITVNTLSKLFPEMEITFFRNERQTINPELSSIENKIVSKLTQLDEDTQLELLAHIGGLIVKGGAEKKHRRNIA